MIPPRRKKWTEAEEKTLIDKYGEMVADGSLAKMRTREKKFKPIACHVNSVHHVRDPVAYPWQWSWKDVSTKVQNMRHQYLLVKQKIKRPEFSGSGGGGDCDDGSEFDWVEGLTHWSNFLRYKDVFGDVALAVGGHGGNELMGIEDGDHGDRDGDNGDGFLAGGGGMDMVEFGQLREMETRFEQREVERERERQRRENLRVELDKQWERKLEEREKEREEREKERDKLRRQRMAEWEAMEKENEEMERKRREEELIHEREWEERMNCRRLEWKKRVDEMLSQHRAEMGQMQTRFLHEQQNLTNQLLGIFSQWPAQPSGLSDHTSASNHYLSQMMQNLHHVNGIVHGDARVEGDNQEDQFIVDG
ncbi:hypothetical protein GLYMA_05G153300v4 [Glycine max]|nr:hypothetical protein GLYMA_05G153300v4 [Glycine max]